MLGSNRIKLKKNKIGKIVLNPNLWLNKCVDFFLPKRCKVEFHRGKE